jgi:hypothetical protein
VVEYSFEYFDGLGVLRSSAASFKELHTLRKGDGYRHGLQTKVTKVTD